MSYEGWEQVLCKNGHYHSEGCYIFDYEEWKCSVCGEGIGWHNSVNVTNGSFEIDEETGEEERIDGYVELEVDIPATICTCDKCGTEHATSAPTYKIPEKEDVDAT